MKISVRSALVAITAASALLLSGLAAAAPASAVGNTASITSPSPACGTTLEVTYSLATDVVAGAVVINGEIADVWTQSAGNGTTTFNFDGFIDPTMPTYTFGLVNGADVVMADTTVQSACALPAVQFTYDLARCANPDLNTTWQANSNDTVSHTIELRRDGVAIYGPSELAAGSETGVQTLDLGAANMGKPYSLEFYVDGVLSDQVSSTVPYCLNPVLVTTPKLVATSIRVGVAIKGTYGFAGATSYACAWKRGTTTIAGATKCTYVPSYLDYGKRLTLVVTATNSAGSTVASSAASAVVALGYAPKVVGTYYPKIVGTPTRGKYVSLYTGKWTPVPTGFTCTFYRYAGTKLVKIGSTFKCVTGTKLKIPTKYAKGTKYAIVFKTVKAGYASATRVVVFRSR